MIKFYNNEFQELPIKTWIMPDGAPHCDISAVSGKVNIVASVTNFSVIGELLCVIDALDASMINKVIFTYLPLRQDRRQSNFPYTMLIYARLLNEIIDKITFVHPHNEENTRKVFPNAKFIYPNFLEQAIAKSNPDAIIIPDKGAKVLVDKFNLKQYGLEIIYCEKTRDSLTGQLSNPVIHGDVTGKNLLITDDLGDGFGTHIQLAKECKKQNCNNVSIYVTHSIFSKGFGELNKIFKNIFTTDSFNRLRFPYEKNYKVTEFTLNIKELLCY